MVIINHQNQISCLETKNSTNHVVENQSITQYLEEGYDYE